MTLQAPKWVLYVCLTATKIGVRRHTGFVTWVFSHFWAVFGQLLCLFVPPFVPLMGHLGLITHEVEVELACLSISLSFYKSTWCWCFYFYICKSRYYICKSTKMSKCDKTSFILQIQLQHQHQTTLLRYSKGDGQRQSVTTFTSCKTVTRQVLYCANKKEVQHCKRETPIRTPIWIDIGIHIGKIGFHIGIHIGMRHSHHIHIGSVSDYWNIVSDFSTNNKMCPVPSVSYRKCVRVLNLYIRFFNEK
jgi:hypothetical protein